MAQEADVPTQIEEPCPTCGEDTLHEVLKGNVSTSHGYSLEAKGRCEVCGNVKRIVVKTPPPREVRAILSRGAESERTTATLPGDEPVTIETELIVDGVNTLVTGIETTEGLRVDAAAPYEVGTLWVKEFEEVPVKWSINLKHKTIVKRMDVPPDHLFSVGDEEVFGRLHVTVHAIKSRERLVKRGSVEAADVVRVFARPTPAEKVRRERSEGTW